MGQASFWVISIIAPAILLIVLIWLVIRSRSNRKAPPTSETREGTRELYAEEEERRREGTDEL
jgi:heme exporter protein D